MRAGLRVAKGQRGGPPGVSLPPAPASPPTLAVCVGCESMGVDLEEAFLPSRVQGSPQHGEQEDSQGVGLMEAPP